MKNLHLICLTSCFVNIHFTVRNTIPCTLRFLYWNPVKMFTLANIADLDEMPLNVHILWHFIKVSIIFQIKNNHQGHIGPV